MDTVERRKTNYYYIDESGAIGNDSKVFIHGCIKTDSPHAIRDALVKLRNDILDNVYYDEFYERILKEGFHAVENNLDMRADVYKLLPLLNFRAYFVILKKESPRFQEMKEKMEECDIFQRTLTKLLKDRITKHKRDENVFVFETIDIPKKPLSKILEGIFIKYENRIDCKYSIVGKEEENMGVIDYLNYLFYHILSEEKPMKRMFQNFSLLAPKMGVVYIMHNDVYLSRRGNEDRWINAENLLKEIGG